MGPDETASWTHVLCGPPAVGKTTVAKRLAKHLGVDFDDLDELVAAQTGRAPADLIRADGESAFRQEELNALRSIDRRAQVLALGGGTLTSPKSRTRARALGPLVGLHAPIDTLEARSTGGDRPLSSNLAQLLSTREDSYRAVDRVVSASGPLDDVTDAVTTAFAGLDFAHFNWGSSETRVLLGHDLETAARGVVHAHAPRRPVLLIEDQGVPSDRRDAYRTELEAAAEVATYCVPGGEPSKSWAVLKDVLEFALAQDCGRQSLVVGLGGGATCDLAGLAASLLGRGAPLALIPSTMLSQLDASVGGKTAINAGGGRNLIGTFHPAADVLIDVNLPGSQRAEDYRSGLAEAVKIGIICDPELFVALDDLRPAPPPLLRRAVTAKASVIGADLREAGQRKLLNLGHTVAHALEADSGFALRHGDAVAMGLAHMASLSARQGWCSSETEQKIFTKLEQIGLPVRLPPTWRSAVRAFFMQDKKAAGGEIDLITIQKLGKVAPLRVSYSEAMALIMGEQQ